MEIVVQRRDQRETRRFKFWIFALLAVCFFDSRLAAQSCVTAPANNVSWWTGDGDASDLLGNNPGNIEGGISFSSGEVGDAFTFDGYSGYIYIPASSSLDLADSGTGLTVECWINISTLTNLMPIAEWNNGSSYGVHFWVNESGTGNTAGHGALYVNFVNSANGLNNNFGSADGVLSTNGWQHIAMTYDETTGNSVIYYNGASVASHNNGKFVPQTSYDLYLGCRPSSPGAAVFSGQMDEIGIYNRALSAAEIQSIYAAGGAGKCKAPTAAPEIVSEPVNETNFVGGTAIFSVQADGGGLTYQWFFNGAIIPSATYYSLSLSNLVLAQAGNYWVVVSNADGTATSSEAVLTLTTGCIAPSAGMAAEWSAEGNATDNLVQNNGVLAGGVTFAPGEVGQAFEMNGTNAYVFVPASSSLNIGASGNGISMECWIKPNDLNDSQAIMEWNNGTSFGVQFWINTSGKSNLYVNFTDTAGANHFFGSPSGVLNSNVFQHVAATYNPSTGIGVLYCNGAAVASQSLGQFTPQTGYNLALGCELAHGIVYYFNGLMDEVSIYDQALPSSSIQAIYTAGAFGKCPPPAIAPNITTQPASFVAPQGSTGAFQVVATGNYLSYQWFLNNAYILGATNSTLTLSNIHASQSGSYLVVVSNAAGVATSTPATLTLFTNCISTASGLVDLWSAEGNAYDSAGSNPGTLEGSISFANGETGRAFAMGGTNANVFIPASSSLNIGAQGTGITMECWIKPSDLNDGQALFEWASSTTYGVQFLINANGKSNLYANFTDVTGVAHNFGSASGILNSNSLQHVAATYNPVSGIGVLYYNGTAVASQSLGQFTLQTTYNFSLGSELAHGGDYYYNGLLDEASLYNRALSAAEIQEIYIVGSGRTNCTAPEFVSQPTNQSVFPGTNITFFGAAFGSIPLIYQWLENGTNVPGATNVSISVTNVLPSNAGSFSLRVTNSQGFALTTNATLNVVLVTVYGNGSKLTNSLYSYSGSVAITLTNFYTGGYIFYTLDGSTPTPFSTVYSGPIMLSNNAVIRTLAFSVDFTQYAYSTPLTVQVVPGYTLTTGTPGGGTITRSPTNAALLSNTVVTLTATPASGWTFLQWQGDTSGTTATNTFVMTRNKSVQAVFGTTVTNSVGGSGSVVFDPPGPIFPYGYALQASAIPQAGNVFVLWGNAASGSTNPLSFLVTNANPEISALFTTAGSGQVALAVIPTGHGSVTVNPRANSYASGSSVTLTATPNSGKSFLGWSGNASGTQNPLTVVMNQSKVIYANFSTNYSLTIATVPAGINQGVELSLSGELGTHYRLDTSTDMVNWTALFNLTNAVGTLYYLDTNTTNTGEKFYRSIILP